MDYDIASLQGMRPSNEDSEIVYINLDGRNSNENRINIYGVFDGHGGKLISKFGSENLYKYFLKLDERLFRDREYTSRFIMDVFNRFTQRLVEEYPRACVSSGSTCCMCILTGDNYLWVINLGDSRAVMLDKNNNTIELSKDHKPNMKKERERIEKLGGKDKIYYDGSDWRVVDLSLSRALGDMNAHPYVSHLPEIYRYKIDREDKYLIVGCDGLYDVLKNEVITKFVADNIEKKNIARLLADKAINSGSTDNVSTIVVRLS